MKITPNTQLFLNLIGFALLTVNMLLQSYADTSNVYVRVFSWTTSSYIFILFCISIHTLYKKVKK